MLKYCLFALFACNSVFAMDSADLQEVLSPYFDQKGPSLYKYYGQGHSQAAGKSAGYCNDGMLLYKFDGTYYQAGQESRVGQNADENWQCVGLGVKYD